MKTANQVFESPNFLKEKGIFINMDTFEEPNRTLKNMIRLGREIRKSPEGIPPPSLKREEVLKNLNDKSDFFLWIGHSTGIIKIDGKFYVIDPIFYNLPTRRYVSSPIFPEDIPKIDYVLISHNHYDHLDIPSVKSIAMYHPKAKIIVPLGVKKFLECLGIKNVIELDWFEEYDNVVFVPSQHWSMRFFTDLMKSLWGGYFIRSEKPIYYSGDTGFSEKVFTLIREKVGSPYLAIMSVGAYEPRWFMKNFHMSPFEAVKAFEILGGDVFVPVHWGTFKQGAEPLDETPRTLKKIWQEENPINQIKTKRLAILKIGESIKIK